QAVSAGELLSALAGSESDAVDILAAVVAWLRPPKGGKSAPVIERIEQLVLAAEAHEAQRDQLARRIQEWLGGARHLRIYTELGLFSRRGLFRELGQLLYNRIN